MSGEQLEFKITEKWAKFMENNPWASFIPEFAENNKGQKFMKGLRRSVVYRIVSEDDQGRQKYECAHCGSEILNAKVAHPIWDGPFPCTGSGRCHYESVPYCPNCEEEPNFNGFPIEC